MLNKSVHFRHPSVRDLAWVIGSVPLLDDPDKKTGLNLIDNQWVEDRFERHLSWLAEIDREPASLLHFLNSESTVLVGKHFEALLKFWFTHHPDFGLKASHVQLQDEQRTLGEIDFIVSDHWTGETFQLEAACKYYYAHTASSDWNEWWGPNHQDRLALKMQKFHVQTKLLRTAEGKTLLRNWGMKNLPSVVLLKGYLFYPFQALGKYPFPHLVHKKHNAGWYISKSDIGHFRNTPMQWVILPRTHRLAPYHSENNPLEILDGEALYHKVNGQSQEKTWLIAQLASDENGFFKEQSRGMVVQ